MNKTQSNQLEELTFINAASLPYAHVDIDGNTLFSGRNGAGKTTILRAVLYFYGAYRNEALGISRKKKRFEEYYFTKANSYLIYRFSNDFGKVLAIVYKTSGMKLKYRFLKEPAESEVSEETLKAICFNGGVAKESKELFNAFLGAGYELSPVINSSKEYKNILYGQDRRLITYSFYQANAEYEQIAKTLSNIFVNSKLDSGSIKKSLAASINGFAPIDLGQMEQMIEGFWEQYEDIQNFEKHQDTITEAIGSLASLEEHNESIKRALGQLEANRAEKEEMLVTIVTGVEDQQSLIQTQKEAFDEAQQKHQERKESFVRNSAVLEAHIKEAKQKKAYYQAEDIQSKLQAWGTLSGLLEQQQSVEKQKSLLTQEYASITHQFEVMLQQEEQGFRSQKQSFTEQLNMLERSYNEKISSLMQDQQHKMEAFEVNKEGRLAGAKAEFDAVKEAQQKMFFDFNHLQNQAFMQEEIQVALQARSYSSEALSRLHNQMSLAKKDLELIFGQVSQKEHNLSQTLEHNRDAYVHHKERYTQQRASIEAKLEHFEHSLFGFIKEQRVPEEKNLLKVLKEEVLFNTKLSPKVLVGGSLLGIDLDFDALEDVDFDVEGLKRALAEVVAKEQSLTKAYDEKRTQLENDTRNELNALKRQEQALRQQLDALALQLPKLERASLESVEALDRLQKDALSLKDEALLKAKTALEGMQKSYHEKLEQLNAEEAKLRGERQSIIEALSAARAALSEETEKEKSRITAALEALEAKRSSSLEMMRQQEEKALSEGGIDTQLLKQYEIQLAHISGEILAIRSFENIVKEYEIDSKRLFGNLAEKETEMEALTAEYNKEALAFTSFKREFEEQTKESIKKLSALKRKQEAFRGDLAAFEAFKDSGYIHEIQMQNIEPMDANEEGLKELIEIVKESLYLKRGASDALGKKLRRVFDKLSVNSSFNIERPASDDEIEMIMAAKALQNFVLENKIETFKTEVARLYGTTLHHISSETTELLKADGEIRKTVNRINRTLQDLQGIKVIEKVELNFKPSENPVLNLLTAIGELTAEMPYGNDNLFSQGTDKKYHKSVIATLIDLSKALDSEKNDLLSIDDSFVLEFRAIENGHDTGFVSSLDGIGSNGTDVMVKAMVYIAMLSLAREQSSKKESAVYFHCILDEVGILAPNYLKELINYANGKQIRFLNGAPDEKLVTTYKRLYMLSTNAKHQTMVRRLLAQV